MKPFLLLYLLSAGLDTGTTCVALHAGARERNPVLGQTCSSVVPRKAVLTTLVIAGDREVWSTGHRKAAKGVLILGLTINSTLVVHNLAVLHRQGVE